MYSKLTGIILKCFKQTNYTNMSPETVKFCFVNLLRPSEKKLTMSDNCLSNLIISTDHVATLANKLRIMLFIHTLLIH